MASVSNDVRDNGLQVLPANVDAIYVCSQEPSTYAEATSTYSLGVKTGPTISAPQDAAGGGREVVSSAFSNGSVTADGTATAVIGVDTTP